MGVASGAIWLEITACEKAVEVATRRGTEVVQTGGSAESQTGRELHRLSAPGAAEHTFSTMSPQQVRSVERNLLIAVVSIFAEASFACL